jgi:putative flippase GtrA
MLEKFKRWVKFNVVGGGGMIIQLSLLVLLTESLQIHYLLATLLAVEGAILHNFVWHELWTWKDKRSNSRRALFSRLLRFHLANGTTSLVGNLVIMKLAVGHFQMPVLAANLLAIAACSIINFLLSDSFVFKLEDKAARGSRNPRPLYPCSGMPGSSSEIDSRSAAVNVNNPQ